MVLDARPHGETSAIVRLFTRERGVQAGLVRGGRSRKLRPVLQTGNVVAATWKARLEDHLGTLRVELTDAHAGRALDDPLRLAALASTAGLLATLAERDAHPALYDALAPMLEYLETPQVWVPLYVRWELAFLEAAGFGLQLERCAVTGAAEGLSHVSPRTGRVVSATSAHPYVDRLLPIPAFLLPAGSSHAAQGHSRDGLPTSQDITDGLKLLEHFLVRDIFEGDAGRLPSARQRLARLINRAENKNGEPPV